jgi:hypothetical protein
MATRSLRRQAPGQGSVISLLFANIYLHYVLDLWADRNCLSSALPSSEPQLSVQSTSDRHPFSIQSPSWCSPHYVPTASDQRRRVELLTGIEGASSRPVRKIVLRRD